MYKNASRFFQHFVERTGRDLIGKRATEPKPLSKRAISRRFVKAKGANPKPSEARSSSAAVRQSRTLVGRKQEAETPGDGNEKTTRRAPPAGTSTLGESLATQANSLQTLIQLRQRLSAVSLPVVTNARKPHNPAAKPVVKKSKRAKRVTSPERLVAEVTTLLAALRRSGDVEREVKKRITTRFSDLCSKPPHEFRGAEWQELKNHLVTAMNQKMSVSGNDSVLVETKMAAAPKSRPERAAEEARAFPQRRAVPKLTLKSKHGERVAGDGVCDECRNDLKLSWRYLSDRGAVHLCGLCRDVALERSFGAVDAMTVSVQGGRIDSNRRRH